MKKLVALSLAACMAFATAACGSSSETTAEAPAAEGAETETPEAEAPEAEAPETDAEEPAASTDGKTWIIAMDTVFRPFEFTDENGEFVGIDVDIIKAIAEDQGFNIEIQSLGWDAAVTAVQAGQADGLIAGASITDERKENGWIFSDGYYTATQSFTVKSDSGIASLEDLNGKTVAVKNGTAGQAYANELKDQYGFTVKDFKDSPTMYQDVVLGNSAACVEDTPIMADSIKTGDLPLTILEDTANEGADYGFAIMDESKQELLDMFNAGLADIKANGTYDEIVAKYVGE